MDKGTPQFTKRPPPALSTAGYWGMAVLVSAYLFSPPAIRWWATAGAFIAYSFLLLVVYLIREVVSSVKAGRPTGPEFGLLSALVTRWVLGWLARWRRRSDPSN